MEELNQAQLEAVQSTEGAVAVIAGAGSGKTRTIANRYAYLMLDLGIMPSSILCISFTNKSAAQMRKRIQDLAGPLPQAMICTFHAFCAQVLRKDGHMLRLPKTFALLDTADQDALLNSVYEKNGYSLQEMPFQKAKDMIAARKYGSDANYKEDLLSLSLQDLADKEQNSKSYQDRIFYGYLYEQKKCSGLDYDDLIILTVHLFEEHEESAKYWQNLLEYIMIDEYQDVDFMQDKLLAILSKGNGNVMVVGDPDQTIYTWRGASVRYLMNFDEKYQNVKTIYLNENYRSTAPVLECANTLIAHNTMRIKKELFTLQKPAGVKVKAGWYADTKKEAKAIADQIETWLQQGVDSSEIAVLYRAHFVSRAIEEELVHRNIAYELYSGTPFYARSEIKDVLAYCRMAVCRNDLDFVRTVNTPKRMIGKSRMEKLQTYADANELTLFESLCALADTPEFASTKAKEYIALIEDFSWQDKAVSTCISELLDQSGYMTMLKTKGAQERLDNVAELLQAAAEYETSWGEETDLQTWLMHTALSLASDNPSGSSKIRLMSIHTAKGLEFERVWIAGMNEAILPSAKANTKQALEEERRLAFVAFTRAKEQLVLSAAGGTLHASGTRIPSRFLFEAQCSSLVFDPPAPEPVMQKTRFKKENPPEVDLESVLQPGAKVKHAVFGTGTVLSADLDRQCYTVHFESLKTKRTLSMNAKLEKL